MEEHVRTLCQDESHCQFSANHIRGFICMTTETHIRVRTQFEGFHFYPGAGDIDKRIKFLESTHRHMFRVEVKIQVFHSDRELEFFVVQWALKDFIKFEELNNKSCEMIAFDILDFIKTSYGANRKISVTVSEDGESDGIVEYTPHGA